MGGLQGTKVWTGHFLRDLAKREICILYVLYFSSLATRLEQTFSDLKKPRLQDTTRNDSGLCLCVRVCVCVKSACIPSSVQMYL